MQTIKLSTKSRDQFIDMTSEVQKIVNDSGIENGMCIVYCPHTTAAITINENADPSVKSDLKQILNQMIPWENNYEHSEGNSAAHAKSSLFGCSETIIIKDSNLILGTWQGIFFCEFDGPRQRQAIIDLIEK